jgi:hypothetical protein
MRWSGFVTSAEVAPPKRGRETALDMVRSLGLIAVIVAITLIFVPSLVHPGKSHRFPAVDYADYVSGFHQVTDKTALSPAPVPSGFIANAGALTGPAAVEHLHIGFATPGSKYAGLEESVGPTTAFLRSVLGASGALPIGHVAIDGVIWQESTSARGEYSLSRVSRGITLIITGSTTAVQQQALAGSLR